MHIGMSTVYTHIQIRMYIYYEYVYYAHAYIYIYIYAHGLMLMMRMVWYNTKYIYIYLKKYRYMLSWTETIPNIPNMSGKYWTSCWSPVSSIWELRTNLSRHFECPCVARLFGVSRISSYTKHNRNLSLSLYIYICWPKLSLLNKRCVASQQ